MGEEINVNRFWMDNSKGKYVSEDLGVERKILYKYILIRWECQD